jgi:hypothetical protein
MKSLDLPLNPLPDRLLHTLSNLNVTNTLSQMNTERGKEKERHSVFEIMWEKREGEEEKGNVRENEEKGKTISLKSPELDITNILWEAFAQ